MSNTTMLDFWYSDKCHRQIKLFLCVAVCVLIYMTAKVSELSLGFVLTSLGLGATIHILREIKLKLIAQNRYPQTLDALFFFIPLLYWLALIWLLPKLHVWALMLQALGFMLLGLFVISIYSSRSPRHAK